MKALQVLFCALLIGVAGCESGRQPENELITVDVTQHYPKKKLVLQDFLQVEYVPLEISDEFVNTGNVKDVTDNYIVITNGREGDLLLFDRATGKGLQKINRKGQGPEEYLLPINVLLEETTGELFVNDGPTSRIQVYDLSGNYKRSLSYRNGAFVSNIYKYDQDHLLCQDTYAPENTEGLHSFFLLSKQTGNTKILEIPYEKKLSTMLVKQVGDMVYGNAPRNSLIVPYQGNWILTEPSADTVYTSIPNTGLHPFLVRIPSVQSMTPEVFLFPGVQTDRYCFLQTVKKECDLEKNEDMPKVNLMYDRQEKKLYECQVNNGDFKDREEDMSQRSLDQQIVFCTALNAAELVEANSTGELKGRLQEIASLLDEEDNPVIMLVKRK